MKTKKATRKQPKEQIGLRIDKRTLERLDAVSERTGLSVGFMIRQSVEAALPQLEAKDLINLNK